MRQMSWSKTGPGGPRFTMTGLLFAVFCVASVVLLVKLFKKPDPAYTPVEVRDTGGVFQTRDDEAEPRKDDGEVKPVSSLEFIPKRQVEESQPYEASEPEPAPAATPAPAQPAPTPAPPQRPAPPKPVFKVVKPRFVPTPESKTASGATTSAFLAAPKQAAQPNAEPAKAEPAKSEPAKSPAGKPAEKPRDRQFRDILTGR